MWLAVVLGLLITLWLVSHFSNVDVRRLWLMRSPWPIDLPTRFPEMGHEVEFTQPVNTGLGEGEMVETEEQKRAHAVWLDSFTLVS
jgi:hypothetical protein